MAKNIKILILADAEAPHTQRWVNWLITNGLHVDLITFNPKILDGYIAEPKVISSSIFKNLRLLKMIVIFLKLYWRCLRNKYDVVHAHSCGGYSWCSAFLGIPYIATPWGTDLLVDIKHSKLNYLLTKLSLARASLITTDGKHFINILKEMGIKTPIEYHIFGTDIEKLEQYRKKHNERQRSSADHTVTFISTRTLYPMHSVEHTIRAFIDLTSKYTNVRLVIVGGGDEAPRLRKIVSDGGVSDLVRFTGMLSESVLFNELANADVYISTSPHDAGLAASTAEAMSIGLPIIHVDVGDNEYWASEDSGGFIAKVNSVDDICAKMQLAIEQADQWENMSKKNMNKIASEYNQSVQMTEMVKLYHNVASAALE